MDRRGRIVLEEAQKWVDEGIAPEGFLGRLEDRYRDKTASSASWAADSFYAVGGILLGAAIIAVATFMELHQDEQMQAFFLMSSSILFVLGMVIRQTKAEPGLVDAAFIAALVPAVGVTLAFDGLWYLQWIVIPLGVTLVVLRRDRPIMVTAATIATLIATPASVFGTYQHFVEGSQGDTPISLWWIIAVLGLAITMVAPRFDKRFAEEGPQAVAAISYVIACIAFMEEVINPDFPGGEEVVLAAFFGAILGAGLLAKTPPVVIVAILALTVDAIVFAFDVGGFALGVSSLIILSIAMVAAAIWMQKRGVRLPGAQK